MGAAGVAFGILRGRRSSVPPIPAVNDDKKHTSVRAGGGDEGPDGGGDPWFEDDGGGATVATTSPSFDLSSHLPSPLGEGPSPLAPPPLAVGVPARPKKHPSTLQGFAPVALPGAAPDLAAPPASDRLWAGADDRIDAPIEDQEDGPTVFALAPAPAPAPASSRSRQLRGALSGVPDLAVGEAEDKDSQTMAIGANDPRVAALFAEVNALAAAEAPPPGSREARGQDAQIVVAEDAAGDDATMAAVPGRSGRGGALDPALSDALVRHLKQRESSPSYPQAQPSHVSGSSGSQPVAHSWAPAPGGAYPQPHAGDAVPGGPRPVGPPFQTGGHAAYAPAPQAIVPSTAFGVPGGPAPGYGPSGGAPPSAGPAFPSGLRKGWPPAPAPAQAGRRQVFVLLAVGVVCVLTFVAGIVLFLTAKF
jgi:hypothetical protein